MAIVVGFGANLGDRMANILSAIEEISNFVKVKTLSAFYESKALLPENAENHWDKPYINGALHIETELEPLDLLRVLKDVEAKIGRSTAMRWAPRVIDFDILLYGNRIEEGALNLPHSQFLNREFTLIPTAEILPDLPYPGNGPYKSKKIIDIAKEKFKESKLWQVFPS